MPGRHDVAIATRTRPVDRGTLRGRADAKRIGAELRSARIDRGLSLRDAARATGTSPATWSRVERALAAGVPLVVLHRMAAVVGQDLSARTFPGGQPIRDAAHAALLAAFRARLHSSIRCSTEVPLPISGDQRGWDALIRCDGWRYGVELETAPHDAQALKRRLLLKARDGGVNGVLLVVPASRRARAFLDESAAVLLPDFPVPGRRALDTLANGSDPGGSAIIVLHVARVSPAAPG